MIRLLAPAKLTLSLAITGVRSDGFHLINAEMVSLDIADEIVIAPADSTAISVVGPYALGVPTNENNLVFKALDGSFSFKVISNRYLLKQKD